MTARKMGRRVSETGWRPCRNWPSALYVDGHVRLYHGSQTSLPKRYVSRQRLCLRGTTDYWVNDALGQPFFVVERPIDHGLLEALRSDIVPRLLKDVPGQPTVEESKADRYRARFVILFDREGYSPEFFKEMWQNPPHRLHHLPQVSQERLASRRVRGDRNDAAGRRASCAATG